MFKVGDKIRLKRVLPADVSARGGRELREDWGDLALTVYRIEKDKRYPGGVSIAIEAMIHGNRMVLLPRDELWVLAEEIDEHGIHPGEASSCCTIRADLFEKVGE